MNDREVRDELRRLAGTLMARPCLDIVDGGSCVVRERWRAPHAPRPFREYDVARMCGECAAYWHVTMAEMALPAAEGEPR